MRSIGTQVYLLRYTETGRDAQPGRQKLTRDLRDQLHARLPEAHLELEPGRLFLETSGDARPVLDGLHGLHSYSPCIRCDLDTVEHEVLRLARERASSARTFAVRVHRVGQHRFTSKALAAQLGSLVSDALPQLRVDLIAPEVRIGVEVRDRRCYVFDEVVPGRDRRRDGSGPRSTTGEPRLLVDQMLGRLTTWLRLVGVDAEYVYDEPDSALVRRARNEGRILVTRDRELASTEGVAAYLVHRPDVVGQLKEVTSALALHLTRDRLFTRCTLCNRLLAPIDKEAARAAIPPVAYQLFDRFMTCIACGKIYWQGGHYERILTALEGVVA